MKVVVILSGLLCYVSAAAYIPVPQLDSAVVQSSRIGGNFAYSTVESKAYAALTPVSYQVPAVSAPYVVTSSLIPAINYPSPVVANYPAVADYPSQVVANYPIVANYPSPVVANYPTSVVADYPAAQVVPVAAGAPTSLSDDDSVIVEAA